MAYIGKTNWQNNEIVEASDMNRIEQGVADNDTGLTSHKDNTSNPHQTTKAQVGLGNVPNVSTNDQTPTFTEAAILENIVSGDKLSILFGKLMKWFSRFGTAAWEAASSFAAAVHTHVKADITDFPATMTPSAHKSTHATGGDDALSPVDIGALALSGGTLTGALTLAGDPTSALHAATKQYVDATANAAVSDARSESLLRDLKIMLNLALGMPDTGVDAWADLLSDWNQVNVTVSDGNRTISTGGLQRVLTVAVSSSNEYMQNWGNNNGLYNKVAQTFTITSSGLDSVKVYLAKYGSPTDTVTMKITAVSGDIPTTTLYNATAAVNVTSSSGAEYTFNFDNVALEKNTTYAFVLERTGAQDSSNYYKCGMKDFNPYANGKMVRWGSSDGWNALDANDMYFYAYKNDVNIVWNAKTATEALSYAAICADKTLGTGSIRYYLSDDGSTWTEITALDTLQAVNFEGTSVYLRVVITGDAALNGIAWGGY